jgi:hypothetical protein
MNMKLYLLSLLSTVYAHDHHHQQEFSANRLNELSAKWGIDVYPHDPEFIFKNSTNNNVVGFLRHQYLCSSSAFPMSDRSGNGF